MRKATLILLLSVMLASTVSHAQDEPKPESNSLLQPSMASAGANDRLPRAGSDSSTMAAPVVASHQSERFGVGAKFRYYLGETYLNPSFLTAPAFRAAIRMANPPTAYPAEWRQGALAFGRNYGDAVAQRTSFQTARFVSGALIREDPRYAPCSSHNVLVRSWHAVSYTFIDRSDSDRRVPAFSNFVGSAAAGFAGNTYLPAGFANVTHAGQRATLQFGFLGAGNLYREFAPQMPRPLRIFFELIGR